jgi:hypothetical protein
VRIRRVVCGALAAVALGLGACGEDEVSAYCHYGAVSEAQLNGCIDHVGTEQIDRLDTNAARYARGELDECLADAGPFCEPR